MSVQGCSLRSYDSDQLVMHETKWKEYYLSEVFLSSDLFGTNVAVQSSKMNSFLLYAKSYRQGPMLKVYLDSLQKEVFSCY